MFESEDGIAGLGPEPFVSDSRTLSGHAFICLICYSNHLVTQSHQKDPSFRIHIIATYAVHARRLLCEVAPPTKGSIHGACLLVYFPSLHVLPTGKQAGTSLPSSHVPHLWVVCPGLVAS